MKRKPRVVPEVREYVVNVTVTGNKLGPFKIEQRYDDLRVVRLTAAQAKYYLDHELIELVDAA